jgi:hypothetical protein
MKCCSLCGETKAFSEFYTRLESSDGLRSDCKQCLKNRTKARYFRTLDAQKVYFSERYKALVKKNPDFHAQNYAAHTEKIRQQNRENYAKHSDKRKKSVALYAKANRAKVNSLVKAYKAAKINACPKWVRSDTDFMWLIEEAYDLAAMRSKMFGFAWHVDHIVPLRGKKVSGLHVPWNLAVIPASLNCSKQNKFEVV